MSLGGILGQSADMPDNLVLAQKSGSNYTGVLTDLLGTVVPVVASSVSQGCKIAYGTRKGDGQNTWSLNFNFYPCFALFMENGNETFEVGIRGYSKLSDQYVTITWQSSGFSIYRNNGFFNSNGKSYYYLVLGT